MADAPKIASLTPCGRKVVELADEVAELRRGLEAVARLVSGWQQDRLPAEPVFDAINDVLAVHLSPG